ncbi:formyltetrahydrofolate deformylase [Patulibacter minatonensis]|uniref:formyltetrahydrofolate deformylase n=1 Tax=Patulibacter minatonensis TaxID=298163 RepID=UPI000479FD29|nr:formyltetrahydrofolate deformylase [Patulibacter minatonensis]
MTADAPAGLRARLLIDCPDRPGIVAAVSGLLARHGGNIVESDQHSTGVPDGHFFMRMVLDLDPGPTETPEAAADRLRASFTAEVAGRFGMRWRLTLLSDRPRIAVLASREPHCLTEILWRWQRDELGGADIAFVASNHPDHRDLVERFGLTYHHVPATRENRAEAEDRLIELLSGRCELVVLARYMQILTGDFLGRVGVPVINIHHSFLPAFAGAEPYRRAAERGVKIVGATAHYVTEELDAGPIIEQDVVRVDHRSSIPDMVRLGADVERMVLGRAVRWHAEERVIEHGGKTVVF